MDGDELVDITHDHSVKIPILSWGESFFDGDKLSDKDNSPLFALLVLECDVVLELHSSLYLIDCRMQMAHLSNTGTFILLMI